MSERLFSSYWYRVAELRPRLRDHVRIHRHVYRGERWFVLDNPAGGTQYRFGRAANFVVERLDGSRTVNELWNLALEHLGDEAPNQNAMITLLAELDAADAMVSNVTPDTKAMFERHAHQEKRRKSSRFTNPLYLKFPLWDPDPWLDRWFPRVRFLFTRKVAAAWLVLVAWAAFEALRNASELAAYGQRALGEPSTWFLVVLLYPFVKALHELGHAFAAKHWGAPVREIGVMFIIGMPVPYVDASATSAFPSKFSRMVVAAAGILVELALASLALLAFLSIAPGVLKLAAFNVLAIGGISTVLFNGNPLIRFDGYYVLSDAIEVPNLAARASRFLRYLGETHILGLPERRGSETDARVRCWLFLYGACAFVYRIFLSLTIALFVAGKFFTLGILLAVWSLLLQFGLPVLRGLARLRLDPRVGERPLRVVAGAVCAATLTTLLAFGLPLPLWTVSDGVVWLPERSQIRTGAAGMVTAILATPGARVAAGEPLLEVRDPILAAKVRVLEARVREATARMESQGYEDRVAGELARTELGSVRAELKRAKQELGEEVVRAGVAGQFVLPRAEDLVGRYFEKGAVVGYLKVGGVSTLRVVVRQRDVAWVRNQTERVKVRLPGRAPVEAILGREVPQATARLPSLALGTVGGGTVAIDHRDAEGLTATEAFFQFDVLLPPNTVPPGLGLRANVRFDHGLEPIGYRMLRATRRLFLRRLHV